MTAPAEEPGDHPEFTEEEIGLIRLWARSDASAGRQIVVQLACFALPAAVGIYGLAAHSLTAVGLYGLAAGSLTVVGVAVICILLLLAWSMVTTYRDRRKYTLMQSICRKILPGGMEK